MSDEEDFYPCVGICQVDPDSGYCMGCGRPPLASPEISASVEASTTFVRPKGEEESADA